MRKALPGKIILLCFFFPAVKVNAQFNTADSIALNTSITGIINFHNSILGENIHLYNGYENTGYNHLAIGHPYFLADELQNGTVFYDDTYYRNIPLLYDLVQDDVVILQYAVNKSTASDDYKKVMRQDLIKSKVGWFTMPGHEFVRLTEDSNAIGMPGGFYERMYNGKVKLLAKRSKKYVEEVKGQELERRYEQTNEYYIQQNGKYAIVHSAKFLPGILNDKKKELNNFYRNNRKKYKKNKEQLILEVVRYYDQLTTH
ncbi:MAG: hypothetical protein JSS70_12760 [Bacteroidetes bacterium]|nr:hypothetical protein [Bacteroidota bacterium]